MHLQSKRAVVVGLCVVMFAAARGMAEAEASLSVMSFNMWHKDRPRELGTMVKQLREDLKQLPDFVVCQEVVFGRDGEQDNTAKVLGDLMGYQTRGTKRRGDGEGVAIISRYPFEYYGELHLKAQTTKLLLGFNRVSVMGEFMVAGIGRVRVVDVHLTNWGFEGHVRRRQIAETLEWIGKREAEVGAVVTVFGGDFNAKIEWGEMKQVTEKGAAGSVVFQDFNSKEGSMGLPGTPNKRIDHIFVSAAGLEAGLVSEKLFWREGLRDGKSRLYVSDHMCLLHVYWFKGATVAAGREMAH